MNLPFKSIRKLPSGRYQARYRPRQASHKSRTFDFKITAEKWLEELESEAVKGGEVSSITKRRARTTGGTNE